MKKLVTIICIVFTPFYMFGQLSTFDLSSYKLPDISYHQLDFNFDLNGQNISYNQKFRINDDNSLKNNALSGSGTVLYNYYKNSDKLQLNQKIRASFSSRFSDYKDKDGLLLETYGYDGGISILSENRFYISPDFFLETAIDLNGGSYYVHQFNTPETQQVEVNDIDLSVPVFTGFGRIEQVQDARLAVYIFDELNKLGKIDRIPTQQEILNFSQFISSLKKERYFDSRLKKIKDIGLIDSVLQEMEITKVHDAGYFTTINDLWDYADGPIRNSGQRLSFGLHTGIYYSGYESIRNTDIDFSVKYTEFRFDYSLGAGIKYTYEKPLSLYWQSSINYYLMGLMLKGNIEENNDNINLESPQLKSQFEYAIGYYPNTRTLLQLSFLLYYFNAFGEEQINTDNPVRVSHFILQPTGNLGFNYYISPKVRLNITYNINYSYLESNSEYYGNLYNDFLKYNSFNQSFRVGFIYKIM